MQTSFTKTHHQQKSSPFKTLYRETPGGNTHPTHTYLSHCTGSQTHQKKTSPLPILHPSKSCTNPAMPAIDPAIGITAWLATIIIVVLMANLARVLLQHWGVWVVD
jgi:hypothetical protein